jgi:DNA-binding transcriptional LysR family regulator
MDLRHLRYVIVLADELHFGKAAHRLNISQPPLSRQIRLIEDELGVQLFHRTRREVRLTEAGQKFVDEARLVISQFDHATKAAIRADRGEIGRLTIGTVPTQKALLTRCVRDFSCLFPDVHLEFQDACTEGQLVALSEGRIDVGFLVLPVYGRDSIVIDLASSEPMVLGMPKHHRLAASGRVRLQALADEPLIMLPRSHCTGFYDQIVKTCLNAGFSPRIVHEVTNIITGLSLVEAGLGLCLFPSSIDEYGHSGIVFRELTPAFPRVEHALAYRRNNVSIVLRSFITVARKALRPTRGSTSHGRTRNRLQSVH